MAMLVKDIVTKKTEEIQGPPTKPKEETVVTKKEKKEKKPEEPEEELQGPPTKEKAKSTKPATEQAEIQGPPGISPMARAMASNDLFSMVGITPGIMETVLTRRKDIEDFYSNPVNMLGQFFGVADAPEMFTAESLFGKDDAQARFGAMLANQMLGGERQQAGSILTRLPGTILKLVGIL